MQTEIMALRRKQNDALAEAQSIHKAAAGRNLTADEQRAWDAHMANVDDAQQGIEREERMALYGGAQAAAGAPNGKIGMSNGEMAQYSLMRAIKAQANRDWRGAELEREASDATARAVGKTPNGFYVPVDWMEHKQQRAITPASGAAMIPTVVEPQSFIEVLRAKLVLRQAGATFLTGLIGNFAPPARTAGVTAGMVAVATAPGSEGTQTFAAKTMTAKTGAAYVDIYRSTILQSSLDVEALVFDDLGASLQLLIDQQGLHGTGSNNQATGVAATSGIGSVVGGTDGAAPTWANMVALETEVATDNADIGRLAYITNPKVRGKLKSTVVGTDQGMVWPVTAGPMGPVNGYPVHTTSQVSSTLTKGSSSVASAIFFGNWAELVIGIWGGVDITADIPDNRTGTVRVAALVDFDVMVRHAVSFAAMLDALTA